MKDQDEYGVLQVTADSLGLQRDRSNGQPFFIVKRQVIYKTSCTQAEAQELADQFNRTIPSGFGEVSYTWVREPVTILPVKHI